MPGVEIHATIIDALRHGWMVEPLPYAWRLGATLLLALLPALIFPYLSPRGSLLGTAALLLLTMAASLLLLAGFRLWFPPVPALIALALSHPLWSWRRLEFTMRYLNRELQTLAQEPTVLSLGLEPDIATTLGLLENWLPIGGWVLLSANGAAQAGGGAQPMPAPKSMTGDGWLNHRGNLWVGLRRGGQAYQLGLRWKRDEPPTEAEQRLLAELARHLGATADTAKQGTVEMVEARVQQVQAATGRLRQMNQVVADSLAEMADGVLISNAFGQIVLANSHAEACVPAPTGRGLEEALSELELPEALPLNTLLADVLIRQTPAQFYARSRQRDLMVQLAPLVLGSRPGGVIVNITDISLLKASERRRLELLGFLSHDLRSPLVSMLALTEMTRTRLGHSHALEDFLARMENNTHSILGLADDFLNLIRAESSTEIQFREIDLMLIALNALDNVWPQANQKNIAIAEDFQTEEAYCQGNADLIERALVNLLTNAVKYSPHGTTVTLVLARQDGWVECAVNDQGPGIAAEELPFLFDAFRRAGGRAQQAENGYGLGLAFVKVVAQRHDGNISVQSEIGKGSSFCLTLPAAKPAPSSPLLSRPD
jgi:signal transduction histidine kinase